MDRMDLETPPTIGNTDTCSTAITNASSGVQSVHSAGVQSPCGSSDGVLSGGLRRYKRANAGQKKEVVEPEQSLAQQSPVPSATPSPGHTTLPETFGGLRSFKKAKSVSKLVPVQNAPRADLAPHANALIPTPTSTAPVQPGPSHVPNRTALVPSGPPVDRAGCDRSTISLTKAFTLLKSPSKSASSASKATEADLTLKPDDCNTTSIVPFNPGRAQNTFGNGTVLSDFERRAVKSEQRNSQGLYDTSFFFPSQSRKMGGNLTDTLRNDRQSLRRAVRYICHGTLGCRCGDCLSILQDSDVLTFRCATERRTVGPSGKPVTWKQLMVEALARCWNRTTELWEPRRIDVDGRCNNCECLSCCVRFAVWLRTFHITRGPRVNQEHEC